MSELRDLLIRHFNDDSIDREELDELLTAANEPAYGAINQMRVMVTFKVGYESAQEDTLHLGGRRTPIERTVRDEITDVVSEALRDADFDDFTVLEPEDGVVVNVDPIQKDSDLQS